MSEPKNVMTEEQAQQFLNEFGTMTEDQLFNLLTEKLIEEGWVPPDTSGMSEE